MTKPPSYTQFTFQPNLKNENLRLHQQQQTASTIMKKIFKSNNKKLQQTDPQITQEQKYVLEMISSSGKKQESQNVHYSPAQKCTTQFSDIHFCDEETNIEGNIIRSRDGEDKGFLSQNEFSNSQQPELRIMTSPSQGSSKRILISKTVQGSANQKFRSQQIILHSQQNSRKKCNKIHNLQSGQQSEIIPSLQSPVFQNSDKYVYQRDLYDTELYSKDDQQKINTRRDRLQNYMVIKPEGAKLQDEEISNNINQSSSIVQLNGSFHSRNIATAATIKGKEVATSMHSNQNIITQKSPILDNCQIERNAVLTANSNKYSSNPNFYLRLKSLEQEQKVFYETDIQKIRYNLFVHHKQNDLEQSKEVQKIQLHKQFSTDLEFIEEKYDPQNSQDKIQKQQKQQKQIQQGKTIDYQVSILLDKLLNSWHSKSLQHQQQMKLAQMFIEGPQSQKIKEVTYLKGGSDFNQHHNTYKQSYERKEVHQLNAWFESVMQGISEGSQNNYAEFFEQIQCVIQATFEELQRQIHNDCNEKGQLLKKIWNLNQEVLKNMLSAHMHEVSSRESEEEIILKQVEQTIKLQTEEIQKKRLELYKEIDDKLIMNTRLIEQNRYLRKKNKKLEANKQEIQKEKENMQIDLANVRNQCSGLLECIQEMSNNIQNLIKQEQLDAQANILEDTVIYPAAQFVNQLKAMAGQTSCKAPKLFLGIKSIVEKQFINRGIQQYIKENNNKNNNNGNSPLTNNKQVLASENNITNSKNILSPIKILSAADDNDEHDDKKKGAKKKNNKNKEKQKNKKSKNKKNNNNQNLKASSPSRSHQSGEDQSDSLQGSESSSYQENSILENDIWIKNNEEKDVFNFVLDDKSLNTSVRFFIDRHDVEIDANQFVPPVKQPPKKENVEIQCTLIKVRDKQMRMLKKIGQEIFNNQEGIEVEEEGGMYPAGMSFSQICEALSNLRTQTQTSLMQQMESGDQVINSFQLKMNMLNTMGRLEILHQKLIDVCEDQQEKQVEMDLVIADLNLELKSLKLNLQDKNQKYEQFCKRFLEDRQKQSKQRSNNKEQQSNQAVSYLLKFGLQNIISGVASTIQNKNNDDKQNASDSSTASLDPLELGTGGNMSNLTEQTNLHDEKKEDEYKQEEQEEEGDEVSKIGQGAQKKPENKKKKGIANIIGKKKNNQQKPKNIQQKNTLNAQKPIQKPRKSAYLESKSLTKTTSNNLFIIPNNKNTLSTKNKNVQSQQKQIEDNQTIQKSPRSRKLTLSQVMDKDTISEQRQDQQMQQNNIQNYDFIQNYTIQNDTINENIDNNIKPEFKKLQLIDLDEVQQQIRTSSPITPKNQVTINNNEGQNNNQSPFFYKIKMMMQQKPKIGTNQQQKSNIDKNIKHLDEKQRKLYMQYQESMSYIIETARKAQSTQKTTKNAATLMKTIGNVYAEYFKNIMQNMNNNCYVKPLSQLVYELYAQKFGFKNMAEKKIYELLINIKKADEILRIFMFGRLLNLYQDQVKYSDKEIEFYVRTFALLDQQQCVQPDRVFQNFDRASTNIVQAIEVTKVVLSQQSISLNTEQHQKLIDETVKKITLDPNFSIDSVTQLLLGQYCYSREYMSANYKQIFFAVKIEDEITLEEREQKQNQQQNCFINFQEFFILMRNIQQASLIKQQQQLQLQQNSQQKPIQYTFQNKKAVGQQTTGNQQTEINQSSLIQKLKYCQIDQCMELFFSWSDEYNDETDEQVISLKRFMEMCEDLQILQQNVQQEYVDQLQNQQNNLIRGQKVLPKEETISTIQDLQKNWNEVKKHFKLKFIKCQTYNTVYQKIIEKLDKSLQKLNIYDQQSVFEALLLYKLIIDESNLAIFENQFKKLIPCELLQFQTNYLDTLKTRF